MITLNVIGTGSSGNAYILTVGSDSLLLEAGLPLKDIIRGNNYSLSNISDCIVTHKHKDHSKAIKGISNSGIYVWSNKETANSTATRIRLVNYEKPITLSNKNFEIMCYLGEHDCEVTLYKILHKNTNLTFAFITDTAIIPKGLNADFYFIECNFDEDTLNENSMNGNINVGVKNSRVVNTHLSLEYLLAYKPLQDTRTKAVVVLHQSKDNSSLKSYQSLTAVLNAKVYIAEKNKTIILEK